MSNLNYVLCLCYFFCVGNWACETPLAAIHEQNVYTIDGQKAQVRTMQVCIVMSS